MNIFNHVPASALFREACRIEFFEEDIFADFTVMVAEQLDIYKKYALKVDAKRKGAYKVPGRRPSIERLIPSPFSKNHSSAVYSVAIAIERTLERQYQFKSGETYVVLSKAASQLSEAISNEIKRKLGDAPITLWEGVADGE